MRREKFKSKKIVALALNYYKPPSESQEETNRKIEKAIYLITTSGCCEVSYSDKGVPNAKGVPPPLPFNVSKIT